MFGELKGLLELLKSPALPLYVWKKSLPKTVDVSFSRFPANHRVLGGCFSVASESWSLEEK